MYRIRKKHPSKKYLPTKGSIYCNKCGEQKGKKHTLNICLDCFNKFKEWEDNAVKSK